MIIETRGDVIKLRGALVENQWPAIKSAVSLLLSAHPSGVIIDASGLTEVSESGAHTFMDASNFIQAHNARVVVAGMPEDKLSEIRKIPGIRSQLVVASTVEEARSSLEAGGTAGILRKKAKPSMVVPLIGAWPRAIEIAVIEAHNRRAELHLLYVLQIPRNLPIGVPVPELEQEARLTLDAAEKSAKRRGITVRKLTTRSRDITEGVSKFASDNKPELLVIAYSKAELEREGTRYAMIGNICHEVPCDVAIYCVNE